MDSEEALPAGWKKAWSRSRQKPYYSNAALNVSLWSIEEVQRLEASKPAPAVTSTSTKNASAASAATDLANQSANSTATEASSTLSTGVMKITKVPAEALKDLGAFEDFVQTTIKDFMGDEAKTDLEFPPCGEDKRYVINEAADDFELIPETGKKDMGTHIGTFITLYKPGYSTREKREAKAKADIEAKNASGKSTSLEASSVNAQNQSQQQQRTKRSRLDEPPVDSENLGGSAKITKLGTTSRDRRTIEEIQRDLSTK